MNKTHMTGWLNLTNRQQTQAQEDYGWFFMLYPDSKNPTDMNTQEKWDFVQAIGFERYSYMLAARKAKTKYRLDFTKPDFWVGQEIDYLNAPALRMSSL